MAIDSVSSAVSATVQAPPQNRETVRPETGASETQRTESRRTERQEPQAVQQAEQRPPAPVVNTQGQMTGTRINTTA